MAILFFVGWYIYRYIDKSDNFHETKQNLIWFKRLYPEDIEIMYGEDLEQFTIAHAIYMFINRNYIVLGDYICITLGTCL